MKSSNLVPINTGIAVYKKLAQNTLTFPHSSASTRLQFKLQVPKTYMYLIPFSGFFVPSHDTEIKHPQWKHKAPQKMVKNSPYISNQLLKKLELILNLKVTQHRRYLFNVHRLVRSNIIKIATESIQAIGSWSSDFPSPAQITIKYTIINHYQSFFLATSITISDPKFTRNNLGSSLSIYTLYFPDTIRYTCPFNNQSFVHLI